MVNHHYLVMVRKSRPESEAVTVHLHHLAKRKTPICYHKDYSIKIELSMNAVNGSNCSDYHEISVEQT